MRRFSDNSSDSDRMWPLDASLIALSGLVLYLVVTRLRFDDPRWLYNGWTYAVAVPAIALGLALGLRGVASQYVQRSIQVGFLFSVLVHLMLLVLAINMIIFSSFQQVASDGRQKNRSPIRRTVPEYVFQTPQETRETPDWSKPTEAQSASRVIPREQRKLPPVKRSQPRLEMPQPIQRQEPTLKKFMIERKEVSASKPMPADAPGKRARLKTPQDIPKTSSQPEAPTAPSESMAKADVSKVERDMSKLSPRRAASTRAPQQPSDMMSMTPSETQMNRSPAAAARNESRAMPTVGDAGLARRQRQPARASRMRPAGAAPAPMSVAVAAETPDASRVLSPLHTPTVRSGRVRGAQITQGNTSTPSTESSTESSVGGAELARSDLAARAGVPNVESGSAQRAPGRARRSNAASGFAPVGTPDLGSMATAATGSQGAGATDQVEDRLGVSDLTAERAHTPRGGTTAPNPAESGDGQLTLDMLADTGTPGFADVAATMPGIISADDKPEIAAIDFNTSSRPRRKVGGPAQILGTKIAAVESFSRRVMRTSGSAAPSPAGMAGPETEEAIERGLAFLASIQNENGSWSLQGHGEPVNLRSDSAATGLCLLAFQGAGYTHMQHQYAPNVAKGLQFLIDNQKPNGDLYRPEDKISNRNVAFYSHGIAALALNEAYGMTQDEELRKPAQLSLDFIADTQHKSRGGWRYSSQISADTSVTGWMMMALKSGELSGLDVKQETYDGINKWLEIAQASPNSPDRYRYNPYAPNTPAQRHGRAVTPTMTAVGMLMRMYSGWRRDNPAMRSAADYLLKYPPQNGTARAPLRDGYYWYYATQVMFHMGDEYWEEWDKYLNPLLLEDQVKTGANAGSWDPNGPIPDRWSPYAGRLYVTTMNLLNLEVYYRHLPIYEDTAK